MSSMNSLLRHKNLLVCGFVDNQCVVSCDGGSDGGTGIIHLCDIVSVALIYLQWLVLSGFGKHYILEKVTLKGFHFIIFVGVF